MFLIYLKLVVDWSCCKLSLTKRDKKKTTENACTHFLLSSTKMCVLSLVLLSVECSAVSFDIDAIIGVSLSMITSSTNLRSLLCSCFSKLTSESSSSSTTKQHKQKNYSIRISTIRK